MLEVLLPKRVDPRTRGIRLIHRSLLGLAKGLSVLASAMKSTSNGAGAGAAGRTLKLSSKVRALRKLQGTYMGYLRSLKPRQQARVKALRATKGYPAAVRLAKKLASA